MLILRSKSVSKLAFSTFSYFPSIQPPVQQGLLAVLKRNRIFYIIYDLRAMKVVGFKHDVVMTVILWYYYVLVDANRHLAMWSDPLISDRRNGMDE